MLQGAFIILFFYTLGEGLSWLIGGFVPGSVIGMLLLFGALCAKWVKPNRVKPVAKALTGNMVLFFLPAGVGAAYSMDVLSRSWQPILAACLISTLIVLAVVGVSAQWFDHRGDNDASK